MQDLPFRARIYLIAVFISGLVSSGAAVLLPLPKSHSPFWETLLFVALAGLAGGKKVRLMRKAADQDAGAMSLGFAIAFAAMLRSGPAAGLLVNAVACLSACVYPRPQKPHQLLFNLGLSACESVVAGVVFMLLNRWSLTLSPFASFPAIAASCMTFFLINTFGVSVIIALCTGEKPGAIWRDKFQWAATSYLTGACASALALILFGDHIDTIMIFVAPAAFLTYQFADVQTERAAEKQQHIEELQLSQAQLAELYLATIKSLALAIDAKDQYTHQHILRVQRYAVATAKRMGITGGDLEGITTGALLHDIGKLGVPEYVLLKPGRLTEEEFAKIKKHPEIGAAILDPVEFPWPVLPVVKYHHEKWDGTGYPDGLKGEEIPLLARILAVADVYDALTSSRSYRTAWSHEKTRDVIRKDAGTHFDPLVVEAFLEIIDGVVEEMALQGEGPLAARNDTVAPAADSTDMAAREINRASSELWALYEVAQTLSCGLGLQETLEILAKKLGAILSGASIQFLLKDAGADRLRVRASVGLNACFLSNAVTLNAQSLSLQSMQSGAAYLGGYDPDDLLPNVCQSEVWAPLHSAMIIPIAHQGERLGTINLYHSQPNAFTDHDVQLLKMIAEWAAMALYNGLLHDRARSQALIDTVTGLHNVRYLTERLEQKCLLAKAAGGECSDDSRLAEGVVTRSEQRFAVLCLDLDSFKPINDNFGHQQGDRILADLARLLTSFAGPEDVVARYGGDEFILVLDGEGASGAERMATRIRSCIGSYNTGLVHDRLGAIGLAISIGHACVPDDGLDCGTLLSVAYARMYHNKTERKLGSLALSDGQGGRPVDRAAPSDSDTPAAEHPRAA